MNTDALSICKRSEACVCRAGGKSPPIAGCGFWMNREANTWCQIKACSHSSASAEISGERVKRKKNQAAIYSHSAHICVPNLWGLIILPAMDLRALKHLDDGREPEPFTTCVLSCIYCTYVWMFHKRFSFRFLCRPSCHDMENFFHAINRWH